MSDYTPLEMMKEIISWGGAFVIGCVVVVFIFLTMVELGMRFLNWVGEHK